MIISKAIELLNFILPETCAVLDSDNKDALKLGLEALKRIEHGRHHPFSSMYTPLPGESPQDLEIR